LCQSFSSVFETVLLGRCFEIRDWFEWEMAEIDLSEGSTVR
jgi:hypothetical protein